MLLNLACPLLWSSDHRKHSYGRWRGTRTPATVGGSLNADASGAEQGRGRR